MIPPDDLVRLQEWVDDRVPEHAKDQVRVELEVTDRAVTVVERRPPWDPESMGSAWTSFPIARLRYTASRKEWTLYWRDRNLRFHRYEDSAPTGDISELIAEIDRDPTCIFWG